MKVVLTIEDPSPEILALILGGSAGAKTALVKELPKKPVATAAAKTEAATEEEGEITVEAVRLVAQQAIQAGHKAKVVSLVDKYGTDKVSNLAPEHWANFIRDVKAIK